MLKRKENAKECIAGKDPRSFQIHFSHSNKTAKKTPFLRATENVTTWLTHRTSWRFYKRSKGSLLTNSSGSRAFLQAASSSSSTWDQTFWNSQYTSSFDDWWIFSDLGQVSVAWWKTSSQPTVGVNRTPTNTALTDLHNVITFHHANTRGSRAAKRKKYTLVSLEQLSSTCHV